MTRSEELRAQARELHAEADAIADGDERLVVVLRALELEVQADELDARAK